MAGTISRPHSRWSLKPFPGVALGNTARNLQAPRNPGAVPGLLMQLPTLPGEGWRDRWQKSNKMKAVLREFR